MSAKILNRSSGMPYIGKKKNSQKKKETGLVTSQNYSNVI